MYLHAPVFFIHFFMGIFIGTIGFQEFVSNNVLCRFIQLNGLKQAEFVCISVGGRKTSKVFAYRRSLHGFLCVKKKGGAQVDHQRKA